MMNFFTPLTTEFAFDIPRDAFSMVGWVVWFGLLIFTAVRHREKAFKFNRRSLVWLAVLSVLVVLVTPFMGLPVGESAVHLMIFAAVPWMMAGGILGVFPSVLLAGIGGVLLAYLDTHSIFSPLLFMTSALVFTLGVRQRYSSWLFRLLRIPLASAVAAGLVLVPATIVVLILDNSGTFLDRAVIALGSYREVFIALDGMVLIGGLLCTFIRLVVSEQWGGSGESQTAPVEKSLRVRFTWIFLIVSIILLIFGVVLQWRSTEVAARRAVVQQMTETSGLVADGLTTVITTGQDFLQVMAEDVRLVNPDQNTLSEVLGGLTASFSFYDELAYINSQGKVVAAYPAENLSTFVLSEADQLSIEALFTGAVSDPVILTTSGRVSILLGITNADGRVTGVLWGRTMLNSHPLMLPYYAAMEQIREAGGGGQVVGTDGLVLYHTDFSQIWSQYSGLSFVTPTFFEGESVLEYYQPVSGLGLAVVTEVPVSAIQKVVMEKVLPAFLSGLSLFAIGLFVGNVFLGRVQRDIQAIEIAAEKAAGGELNPVLPRRHFTGEMERLAGAFQKMLGTVRSRMQKQSELLSVSERITGQLKLHDSLQVVFLAALEHGVSSARIVLLGDSQKNGSGTPGQQFGLGKHAQAMASLDEDVLKLSQSRGQFVMRDSQIVRQFHLGKGLPYQGLMLAIPLSWKSLPLGVFWVTYDDRMTLSEDSYAYFNDLAHKAATAIINTKAFDESLTTRKRLEAILADLSDPIILADEGGEVVYLNEAARSLSGIGNQKVVGVPFASLLMDEDLQTWAAARIESTQSKLISTPSGKTYQVSISPIMVDGRRMGTVGIFRDISQYKQKEDLKTEFVTLVSHELRSPLSLVQGYANILRLSSNLNEQQDNYLGNIIDRLEGAKALVQELLALGRLEGGSPLVLEEVSVKEIVQNVMVSMEPHARQKHIDVRLDLPEESIYLEADSTLLVQAVNNLVDNAIRYTKNGRSVLVSARKQPDAVVFSVADEGPGIAPLDQRRVFTPFFHPEGQTDPGADSGDGLGLVIAKTIAERHSGKVWFDSKLGQGSTFYFQVPLVQHRS